MKMNRQPTYRFGAFEVNPHARQLRKHGVRLKLYGQSFEILLMLLARPGEVITREQMRDRIWPEGTFVDFEHSLNTAIKNLRRALSDSAESPSFIETLPRVGYRFLARVENIAPETAADEARTTVPADAMAAEVAFHSPAGVASTSASESKSGARWQIPVAAALILAAALGAYLQWLRPHAQSVAESGRIMLAVLPFENLTGDPAQEYFTDGFSEEMITQISPLDPEHLEVIARTSTMPYKNARVPLDQIGRQLGVQYVLEGTVRRDADNVRVSAQLTRVKDQTCLWSHEYNRKLSGSLALQDEVAREVVDQIRLTFGGERARAAARPAVASPASSEAYDFYLRGRYFWNKRTADGFQQAADYFQQAIDKDPNYARAYAGLADTYALMCSWNLVSKDEFVPKARAAALKALEIDDTLAEAHTSLALVVENYDWDWQTAEREYRRAIQLDPGYATAHQWYAEYLTWQGRFDEATVESEHARQLDPLSLIIAADRGAMLYYSRRYGQSIEQFRGVLAMDPNFPRANFVVYPYVKSGMYAEALSDIEAQRRAIGDSDWILSMLAYADANAGRSVEARQTLDQLEQLRRRVPMDPQLMVFPYIGVGDNRKALDALQRAYTAHSNLMTSLKVDPVFDPLRNEPRFQELLRRVGLAQ
ncbi:MAG TPA: winged helix-turn-helix domain-containing protein [Candidatus Acidoferrales bacterium]|jgi:TolB-like protein/DNA-binding winged helix-turn-helix (wHTH) protein/Tfp pilus assembly protein PilF|nr:winged helix-turn-helix domain-containing protein [Candidatus Acidoferrales bacterium]